MEKHSGRIGNSISENPTFLQPTKSSQGKIPMRPFLSSVNCHASNLWKYVDYQSIIIIKEIPSYFEITSYFLKKLEAIKAVPDNSYLVHLVI